LSSPIALDLLSGNDEREEAMRLQSLATLDALSSPIALDALSGNDEREEAMRLHSLATK
jgi:uncharacterized protein YqfB (UPF0267 family)